MKFITLNDGNKMPILGYGVYQIPQNDTQRCVEDAISVGYRSIDTAQAYQNELGVGAAVNSAIKGGIKRDEFFITTKIWVSNATESGVLRSFEASMKKLNLDYLDLLLLHQPYNDIYGAWRAMSRLKNEGRIKSIGVSNFYPDRLVDFAINNEIKPALNQIELNPFHQRKFDREIAKKYGIAVQSWASFGEGRNDMFNNPILKKIGEKYGKSVAQTILRYLIQLDIIVIPKTTRKNRMIENFSVFDFELSTNDMQTIANMDEQKSLFSEVYHNDPATVERLNGWKLPD
ncbi:aldo/keto reductase [Campylobacter sp. JMF_01 NE2]|nr:MULTISPECIES: aldo/keto reductase [unclassified Campylobacter]MDA3052248.1 aldo/keto reductase [Campylobacter sp. JMF_03 NE3]MDA3066582.1 aldo/keto reductase [Campylobacter sp. JMF_01 NE2]